ncbi:MAG TPA: hypothetical protein VFR09_04960 [Alphaproteobacteria bacterium]|nr:hypothetical protein [Alphaproteobacteria bacterium]
MIPEYFVYLGAIINLAATLTYVLATLRGKTRPNRVTWFMWGVAPLIGTAAQIAGGVGLSTLMLFMSGIGPLIVFASSFANKNAYWQTRNGDYICGILSICGLIGWYLTRNQDVAIGFTIAGDFAAGLPTFIKSWRHPESENGPTYIIGIFSTSIGVLCVQQPTFTAYAFISYLMISNAFLCFAVYRGRLLRQARLRLSK